VEDFGVSVTGEKDVDGDTGISVASICVCIGFSVFADEFTLARELHPTNKANNVIVITIFLNIVSSLVPAN